MATPLPNVVFEQLSKLTQQAGPVLLFLVGPNGAGKSTFYQQHLAAIKLPFINADLLAKTLIAAGAPEGDATERLAADLAEKRVVSVKFCKKGIGGMWLDEIKRFMGRVKGGGEATSLSWVSGMS